MKIPKVFVNNIGKINNNKEVYYSYKDNNINTDIQDKPPVNKYEMQERINKLFKSKDFVYKKKFHIKTKYSEDDYIIISKSYYYLLTITGEKIYIDNIIEIY